MHRILDDDNRNVVKSNIQVENFIEKLKGCINVPGNIDPIKLKDIWRLDG